MMRRRVVFLAAVIALLGVAGAEATTSFARRSMARARLDAAKELGSVVLPSGARRVGQDPSVARGLGQQSVACLRAYVVEKHAFWRLVGDPATVWTWMRKHPPGHTRSVAYGMLLHRGKPVAWSITFFLPDQPNVVSRMLSVALRPAKNGATAIRVDAIAVGEPRPHQAPCATASY
jgi:hypothetical protein